MSHSFISGLVKTGFILVIGLMIGSFIYNFSGSLHDVAQSNADAYAANFGSLSKAVCNKYDTDSNGYVTCTVFRRNENPIEIECGPAGCRIPKKIVGINTR